MAAKGPGAKPSSEDALHTGKTHKGSQKHRRMGGFSSDRELARRAGKKGIEAARRRYGDRLFSERGRRGGEVTRDRYGSNYFRELGRRGAKGRKKRAQEHTKGTGER